MYPQAHVAVGLMCESYYRSIAGAMAKAGIIVIGERLLAKRTSVRAVSGKFTNARGRTGREGSWRVPFLW
jgi:hypothetical protein